MASFQVGHVLPFVFEIAGTRLEKCSAVWVMVPCARGLWYQCFRGTLYFSLQIRCDWGEDCHWQSDRIVVTQSWMGEWSICRVEVELEIVNMEQ